MSGLRMLVAEGRGTSQLSNRNTDCCGTEATDSTTTPWRQQSTLVNGVKSGRNSAKRTEIEHEAFQEPITNQWIA